MEDIYQKTLARREQNRDQKKNPPPDEGESKGPRKEKTQTKAPPDSLEAAARRPVWPRFENEVSAIRGGR
jgi:hypothetical protein